MVVEQEKKDALLQAMTNEYTRKIMLSTVYHGKPIEEIARETKIPISTCYRRVHELVNLHLMRVERITITETGKKYEIFRSNVKDAVLNFSSSGELSVEVTIIPRQPNEKLPTMCKTMLVGDEHPTAIPVIG